MSEIKIIHSQCENPDTEGKSIFTYDILDAFKLDLKFTSDLGDNIMIPFHKFDIKLEFFTKGNTEHFEVYKLGLETSNCKLIPESKILRCYFENHKLHPGLLYCNMTVEFYDSEFESGVSSITETKFTGIQLIDGTGELNVESFTSSGTSNFTWKIDV